MLARTTGDLPVVLAVISVKTEGVGRCEIVPCKDYVDKTKPWMKAKTQLRTEKHIAD